MADAASLGAGEAPPPLAATWIGESGVWYGIALTKGQDLEPVPEHLRGKVLASPHVWAVKGRYGDGVKAREAKAVQVAEAAVSEATAAVSGAQVSEAALFAAEAARTAAEEEAEAAEMELERAEAEAQAQAEAAQAAEAEAEEAVAKAEEAVIEAQAAAPVRNVRRRRG